MYKSLITFLAFVLFFTIKGSSQITVIGTVYDSTKITTVKNVQVRSSNGTSATTDSLGKYAIVTSDKDSLIFIYKNKTTLKFAVNKIPDIGNFEIALQIVVPTKIKLLKEVKVYSKSFKQDSIENREKYKKLFNYEKPGISLSSNSYSGAVGVDLNELINIFRFKRNKQMQRMQLRLIEQEKENYINYRFNKNTVRRVTRLDGNDLDEFMKMYRPDFEFTQQATIIEFYQYILNASYQYKRDKLLGKPLK